MWGMEKSWWKVKAHKEHSRGTAVPFHVPTPTCESLQGVRLSRPWTNQHSAVIGNRGEDRPRDWMLKHETLDTSTHSHNPGHRDRCGCGFRVFLLSNLR